MDEEMTGQSSAITCSLCGSNRRGTLYKGLTDRWFGSPGMWGFDICRGCNLVLLSPSPTAEQLNRAYAGYFTHQVPSKAVGKSTNGGSKPWLVVRAKRAYRSAIRAVDLERSEMRSMYTSDLAPGRLLDIGCGNGLFLKRMSDVGWFVQGVEPDPQSARLASETYGFEICTGTLQDAGFPSNQFDCITMSHVIEHLRDPLAVLAECRRILKPGGMLVITTPNHQCLGHRLFGRRWLGLDPPRHLLLFSRKNLELIAHKAGFSCPKIWTSAVRADAIFNDMVRVQTGRLDKSLKRGWYSLGQLFLLLELTVVSFWPTAGEEIVLKAQK